MSARMARVLAGAALAFSFGFGFGNYAVGDSSSSAIDTRDGGLPLAAVVRSVEPDQGIPFGAIFVAADDDPDGMAWSG